MIKLPLTVRKSLAYQQQLAARAWRRIVYQFAKSLGIIKFPDWLSRQSLKSPEILKRRFEAMHPFKEIEQSKRSGSAAAFAETTARVFSEMLKNAMGLNDKEIEVATRSRLTFLIPGYKITFERRFYKEGSTGWQNIIVAVPAVGGVPVTDLPHDWLYLDRGDATVILPPANEQVKILRRMRTAKAGKASIRLPYEAPLIDLEE